MKKVVVIGGSGFIGSHVADELTLNGYDVTIYDFQKSKTINPKQKFISGDILDEDKLREAIKGADYVYHYAGVADIGEAAENPSRTVKYNILGTTTVLDACVKENIKRFIYASTVYVYSDSGSFYRASKQAAESLIEVYQEKYGIDYTILRYGSLYGERSQSWNGLKKYVFQAVKNQKIDYPGNGQEMREYIHVLDAAKISIKILSSEYKNNSYIITGTQVLKSSELMKMIEEVLGKKIVVNYKEAGSLKDHYQITPYRYTPKKAHKIITNEFVDIGQGILNLIEEIDAGN